MADPLSNLSPAKRRLLERRLKDRSNRDTSGNDTIPRRGQAEFAPLSFAQRQMWVIDRLNPGNPAYNLPFAVRIKGVVEAGVLEAGLNDVVSRHEILRTSFHLKDGSGVQVVHPELRLLVCVVDLQNVPRNAQEPALQERTLNEAVKPFDVTCLPLIRVTLFQLAAAEWVLLFNMHHIVSDGMSLSVLMNELDLGYRARAADDRPLLPELAVQYADFATWEQAIAAPEKYASDLDYWAQTLAGCLPVLELPADFRRPVVQSFKGSNVYFKLNRELSNKIQRLAHDNGATFFMVALAAFYSVLQRWSEGGDVIIGTPVASRLQEELHPLIGNFLNMVPLRCSFSPGSSLAERVRAAREVALGAFSHKDVPFELVLDRLRCPRDPSRNPLFQALLQVLPFSPLKLAGFQVEEYHFDLGFSQVDLALHLYQSHDGCCGRFEYCRELFSHATIKRLAGHFVTFLDRALSEPDKPVDTISILSAVEVEKQVHGWNDTSFAFSPQRMLPELFTERAARSLDKVAVQSGDSCLTYADLDAASDRVAGHLVSLGIGAGVLVGVFVERSLNMVVGLLGVLKSGAAYVPMDPAFPSKRLGMMIEDAAMPAIVTQTSLAATLPPHQAQLICLDQDHPQLPTSNFQFPTVGPESLAYVIFTSGSTGRPKGVEISHGALVNFLESMRREPGLTEEDVLLAVTTLSFDIAGLELWLPLTTGARVVIASRATAMDGVALMTELDRHGVTVLQATPITWRLLLASGWQGNGRLKALCGGEALPADLAAELLPRCGELWNMYGPTETTIWSTCQRVAEGEPITIGRPIANTQVYVVNEQLQLQPIGVPGELLIGGDGLARGYLNRPELTEEKFISNPFGEGKVYRTGDLARWRSHGTLECLGRIDNQVKLRGFRIELGEIEATLSEVAGIKQVVVVARDEKLVAYYVTQTGEPLQVNEVREVLRKRLPDYMVPAIYVHLKEIPLTPNGKVDRKALPDPEGGEVAQANQYVAPQNEIEEKLVAIWEEVLKRKPIGIHDNFFDLGGHSLLAVRLFSEIEKQMGQRLPLAELFSTPTIEGLTGKLLLRQPNEQSWSSLVAIQSTGQKPRLFLVHGAGGNILLYRALAFRLGPDQPVYGFQSQGLDGKANPLTTIEEMAAHYVAELRELQPHGPYQLGGYCMGGMVALEMARRLTGAGEQVDLLALLDTYNPAMAQNGSHVGALLQRARFHLGNFARLRPSEMGRYVTEKLRIARDGELANLLSRSKSKITDHSHSDISEVNGESPTIDKVQRANDGAVPTYTPKPYDGELVVFKPKVNYDSMSDPQMGWGEVAETLKIVELDMNPHAMLVEPYVKNLAVQLLQFLK